jgi:SAM-dependent MidA family methyltransferase
MPTRRHTSADSTVGHGTSSLPPPDAQEQARSDALSQRIRVEIERAGDAIDFAQFMQLALYTPGLGYYSSGRDKFGASGDFVTAPELGSLYAACVARACAPLLRRLGAADVLEVGGGSGALAAALLRQWETLDALPRHYFILEVSADLRRRQAQRLARDVPHLAGRVRWLDCLPEPGLRGVIIANEVLDAMPAQRFCVQAGTVHRCSVAWESSGFRWHVEPVDACFAATVGARVDLAALPDGYTSEINLQAEAWLRSMAEVLAAGALLLVDYGFPRAEFYHPQRTSGTLMCHYRHRAHTDPLILVGLQDITCHVDFTALAEAGSDTGLRLAGYTSQAAFLLANGITQHTPPSEDASAQWSLAHEVKVLTLPQEMGEMFKVMAFTRGDVPPVTGFELQDRRGRL